MPMHKVLFFISIAAFFPAHNVEAMDYDYLAISVLNSLGGFFKHQADLYAITLSNSSDKQIFSDGRNVLLYPTVVNMIGSVAAVVLDGFFSPKPNLASLLSGTVIATSIPLIVWLLKGQETTHTILHNKAAAQLYARGGLYELPLFLCSCFIVKDAPAFSRMVQRTLR
jgi:hypothetical protein